MRRNEQGRERQSSVPCGILDASVWNYVLHTNLFSHTVCRFAVGLDMSKPYKGYCKLRRNYCRAETCLRRCRNCRVRTSLFVCTVCQIRYIKIQKYARALKPLVSWHALFLPVLTQLHRRRFHAFQLKLQLVRNECDEFRVRRLPFGIRHRIAEKPLQCFQIAAIPCDLYGMADRALYP